jgi:hypothetical protein
MANRFVSVGDDLTLPPAVKVGEPNLPDRLSAAAQNATFVRFEDEAGNPLPTRNVVIKVSATTGEIIDIVSEA